jgi:DNA replication and repair protein RecF
VALAVPNHQVVRPAFPRRPGTAHGFSGSWLGRVVLTGFRNYRAADVSVDRRPVVLTGPNGAGKTNLLEAISFLAPGRGLRQARLEEVDRRGSSQEDGCRTAAAWGVAAMMCREDGPIEIGTGRDPEALEQGRDRRLVKINGAFAPGPSALADQASIIWLTPQMDRLFLDGAGARRRFLDRLVYGFDPDHARRLARYERALHERSQLLRQSGPGGWDAAWLAAIEQQIAEGGVAVAAARRELVQRLGQAASAGIGPFPQAGLALAGVVDTWLADMPALAVEDAVRRQLAADRTKDSETGGAQCGPHRSDLLVTDLATGLPASQCSTGEQKALLLSIVLAHARLQLDSRGLAPILLLDEVAAHLDAVRRSALFDELLALDVQAWLTGTDAALFAELGERAQFFRVRAATIAPLPTADRKA